MTLKADDPFNLGRFVQAQTPDYDRALSELRAGRKRTHWMWYVLPQLRGLGSSPMSRLYGIGSTEEARAYLAHPVLGPRLKECLEAVKSLSALKPVEIFGKTDALKFHSCLTLFAVACPEEVLFRVVLKKYYSEILDKNSVELLA